MEVLKVKLFQEVAVYRNPITMEVIETYPLPAPSTVLGLIHQLLGARETIPNINVSIQGEYGALLRDYQHYKKGETEQRYPIIVNALNDVRLTIHISAEKTILEELKYAFHSPPYYPYLGRAEDLLKVESVKIVTCGERDVAEEKIEVPCYIRKDIVDSFNLNGIPLKLPTYYIFEAVKIGKEFRKIRNFQWLDYLYVERDNIENAGRIYFDEEGDKIWWCMPNPARQKT